MCAACAAATLEIPSAAACVAVPACVAAAAAAAACVAVGVAACVAVCVAVWVRMGMQALEVVLRADQKLQERDEERVAGWGARVGEFAAGGLAP